MYTNNRYHSKIIQEGGLVMDTFLNVLLVIGAIGVFIALFIVPRLPDNKEKQDIK